MAEHKTAVLGGGGILVPDGVVLGGVVPDGVVLGGVVPDGVVPGGGGMAGPGSIPLCCGLPARQTRPTA